MGESTSALDTFAREDILIPCGQNGHPWCYLLLLTHIFDHSAVGRCICCTFQGVVVKACSMEETPKYATLISDGDLTPLQAFMPCTRLTEAPSPGASLRIPVMVVSQTVVWMVHSSSAVDAGKQFPGLATEV